MTEVSYCTREQVQHALSQADSAKNNRRIDDAIRAASRDLEGFCRRYFYPTLATRYPDVRRSAQGNVLWLNGEHEIISVTSLVLDGDTADVADFYLDPFPAYPLAGHTSIVLPSTSSLAWPADDRTIALTGVFGGSNLTGAAGVLAGSISPSVTTLTLDDSSLAGVGDLLFAGTEALQVTEKTMATTGATLAADVASSAATTSITVSDGTLVTEGELILIGAERMFVELIVGNTLIVKRAQNASTLAAHTLADVVYAPRVYAVERGAAGTTAASHSDGLTLLRNVPPSLANEAALAMALNNLEQARSAYARQIGAGDTAREASGRGVKQIVDDCVAALGRGPRIGVA